MGLPIRQIWIPSRVTSIGSRAFANCSLLGNVYMPDSITYIAPDAFSGTGGWLTLRGSSGGYVEQYAEAHLIRFIPND